MAARNRISLELMGLDENEGHLDLVVFSRKVRYLHEFIKVNVEEYAIKQGIPSDQIAIRVVNLQHNSPAQVVCEAVCPSDPHKTPFEELVNTLKSVKSGNTSNISYESVSALKNLALGSASEIHRAELEVKDGEEKNSYKLSFDHDFVKEVKKMERLINEEGVILSTIGGKLEQINLHNNTNTFKIYDAILGYSIECKFPKTLREDAMKAIDKSVSVFGECKYRLHANFPHYIKVQEMEILPNPSELPSLGDLRGIAPNMTDGKSPEEFVRELRDGWDSGEDQNSNG